MSFLSYLRHNWPMAAAIAVLLALLSIALASGKLPTNQGSIARSRESESYWQWVRRLAVLLAVSLAALLGSYWLATP